MSRADHPNAHTVVLSSIGLRVLRLWSQSKVAHVPLMLLEILCNVDELSNELTTLVDFSVAHSVVSETVVIAKDLFIIKIKSKTYSLTMV